METLASIDNINKSLLKKEILKVGAQQQQRTITFCRIRRDQITKHEARNTFEYDSHPVSFKFQTLAEAHILNDQIRLANQELDQLMQIPSYVSETHPKVEYGKVVITNKEIFFISAAMERFYVFEFSVVGLSVHSPLYLAMKGKKAGDYFRYNDVQYRIKEII